MAVSTPPPRARCSSALSPTWASAPGRPMTGLVHRAKHIPSRATQARAGGGGGRGSCAPHFLNLMHQILYTWHVAEYMTISRRTIGYAHDDFAQGGLPVARLRPGHRPPRRGPLQPAPGEPSHDCWCEPWCKTLRKGEHTHTHTHTNINNIYIYIYIY